MDIGLIELVDILQCAREALVDAISCENGLDGSTGEQVIDWITDALGDKDEFIKNHSLSQREDK